MATTPEKPEILVIVGPTASGKSELAMKVARKFNGEIIAADSRTIYKGMDIGTAKPSIKDRKKIKHWGLDLTEPGRRYSAAQFKTYALEAINDIQSRGKLPILVGGTGLYIDGVIFDISFVKASRLRRLAYLSFSLERLQKIIRRHDWPMPENLKNKRHLINAAARKGHIGSKTQKPLKNALVIGLMPDESRIRQGIRSRTMKYFSNDLEKEVRNLLGEYGRKSLVQSGGIAYMVCLRLMDGEITKSEARELIQNKEWQYARRQRTWFRRNKFIQWFETPEEAFTSVSHILNNQIGS